MIFNKNFFSENERKNLEMSKTVFNFAAEKNIEALK
jgi:hypothetical protein